MVNDEIVDNIKKIFDSLEKATSWSVVIIFTTLTTALYTENAITVFGATIPKNISGIVMFGILCCINFKIFHLLQNLKISLKILEPDTDIACMRIRLHTWTMNPFFETEGNFSFISDNLGYALLLLLWWLGAQTGFYLIQTGVTDTKLIFIGIFLFFIYLFLGLMSMILISNLIYVICRNKFYRRVKLFLTFIALPIGSFGLKVLIF